MPEINFSDVSSFLKFFNDNPREIFTFCFLDGRSDKTIPGLGVCFSTIRGLEERFKLLLEDNKDSLEPAFTLHVTLNRTSLEGRSGKYIRGVRVFCVDLDTPKPIEEIRAIRDKHCPQMIVESSPGKYHLYWKCAEEIGLDEWSKYQLGLAFGFGGDFSLDQITHTIRVPGVPRILKDGVVYVPRIVYLAPRDLSGEFDPANRLIVGGPNCTVSHFFQDINSWISEGESAKKARYAECARARKEFSASGAVRLNPDKGVGRNDFVYQSVKYAVGKVCYGSDGSILSAATEEEAVGLARELALACVPPLEDDAEKIGRSAYVNGIEVWERRVEKVMAEQKLLDTDSGADSVNEVHVNGHSPETNGHFKELAPVTLQMSGETSFEYDFTDPKLAKNSFSDQGLVRRVTQQFGARMVKIGTEGVVYAFDTKERVWRLQRPSNSTELYSFAAAVVNRAKLEPRFHTEMCTNEDGTSSKMKRQRAEDRLLSTRTAQNIVSQLTHSEDIRKASANIFDANPDLLYVRNGVLNMLTGELRHAAPSDYLLNRSESVSWDAEATCDGFQKFCFQIFSKSPKAEAMVSFIQEVFGYSLSGDISAQVLFCHYGDGSNGKSKLLSALRRIGGEYATYIEPDELMKAKNGAGKSFERFGAKIEGRRVVIVDDVDVKAVWNEAIVKNLTAPEIRARAEYERSRPIANRASMHLGLNVAPEPEAENEGILRRICLIPYLTRFAPTAGMSHEIDQMIERECNGILRWAIEGYRRWVERGRIFNYPEETIEAVAEYREDVFKFRSVIAHLFEAPKSEEDGTWEFLTDIIFDIENYLGEAGKSGSISERDLATYLRRELGLKIEKKWCAKKKNAHRCVLIKLKYERRNRTGLDNL